MGIEPLNHWSHKQRRNHSPHPHHSMKDQPYCHTDKITEHPAHLKWKKLVLICRNQGYCIIGRHTYIGRKIYRGRKAASQNSNQHQNNAPSHARIGNQHVPQATHKVSGNTGTEQIDYCGDPDIMTLN